MIILKNINVMLFLILVNFITITSSEKNDKKSKSLKLLIKKKYDDTSLRNLLTPIAFTTLVSSLTFFSSKKRSKLLSIIFGLITFFGTIEIQKFLKKKDPVKELEKDPVKELDILLEKLNFARKKDSFSTLKITANERYARKNKNTLETRPNIKSQELPVLSSPIAQSAKILSEFKEKIKGHKGIP